MKKKTNREIEKCYFDMFSRSYKIPDGRLIPGDKPDFVIDGIKKIGIELTNYYIKEGTDTSAEQRKRNIRDKVINGAHQIYLAENRKHIEISFSFNDNLEIMNTKDLMTRIVKLGSNLEGHETGVVTKDIFKFIPELSHVYLNSTVYPDSKWKVQQVYFGNIISIERLAKILRDKEEKSKEYIQCEEYWLLIVVDFNDMAQDQEIMVGNYKLQSSIFNKVIVYKTVFNHIIEIQ